MSHITVTDVRAISGDSAFLIDDGTTAVLIDSGFGFTGDAVAARIREVLGTRSLDYIFLTHSHYDHVLGAAYVLHAYPNARVVAGDYADRIDALRVDIAVADGDVVQAGGMRFVAVALPGHTKCSVGFYLPEEKMLVGAETLGVYDGDKILFPCFLVGYQMALDSIAKARSLAVDNLLLPHFGLLDRERTAYYLDHAAPAVTETAEQIAAILRDGGTEADAVAWFKDKFYRGSIPAAYPIDAMLLNTSIMVRVIARERLGTET